MSNRKLARMFAMSITCGEKDMAEKLVGSQSPPVHHPALENADKLVEACLTLRLQTRRSSRRMTLDRRYECPTSSPGVC